MTKMNHVKLGMMIAYQRNYTLRMNTAYKLMVKEENKTAL